MEPEIFRKMKKLNEKLRAKFPVTSHGYSMIKITSFNEAFSEFFCGQKQAHRKVINHCSKKEGKGEKGKVKKKIKNLKGQRHKSPSVKILISAHVWDKNVAKHIANAF